MLSAGSVDTGFSTGTNLGTVAYSAEGQADGKVIVGGSFSTFFGLGKRYLGRLTPTGALDESYAGNDGPDGITNLQKYALGFQGDPREPTRLWGDGGLLFGFRQDESSSGFRFRTDLERTDVHVHAEWSTGLSQWTIEGLEVVEQERNGSRVTWEATLNGAHPAAFFRVRTALSE